MTFNPVAQNQTAVVVLLVPSSHQSSARQRMTSTTCAKFRLRRQLALRCCEGLSLEVAVQRKVPHGQATHGCSSAPPPGSRGSWRFLHSVQRQPCHHGQVRRVGVSGVFGQMAVSSTHFAWRQFWSFQIEAGYATSGEGEGLFGTTLPSAYPTPSVDGLPQSVRWNV